MRKFLIAALMAAGLVTAQDPFLSGDALQAEIANSCADGCVMFSREQAAEFEDRLGMVITNKMREAFAAGVAHQKQSCASLI